MKKSTLLLVCIALLATVKMQSQTNPVAEYYPDGYPIWTDQIQWSDEINMATDTRITAITGEWARFEKGIELLGADGGVLYYPAGTYVFSDLPAGTDGAAPQGEGIMLRSGVVIKGAKPTKQIASEVANGLISLTTKFEFPLYNRLVRTTGVDSTDVKQVPGFWNFVGMKPRVGQTVKDINNIGVCFIQFKYGGLYWGAEYAWAASYSDPTAQAYGNSGVFPKFGWMKTRVADGTHYNDPFGGCAKILNGSDAGTDYKGAGSGRLVLGCRFDEAVLMDAGGSSASAKDAYVNTTKTFNQLAIDSYRFAGRITIDAKNVLIASNAITKPVTLPFIYKASLLIPAKTPYPSALQNKVMSVPMLFDPAKQIGIDLGKSVTGLVLIQQRAELKEGAPFYEPNMIVRDNYVYNHGNKGIEVAGKWVKILNNVNDRDYLLNGTPSTSATVSSVGDALSVYGINTAIPYNTITVAGTTVTVVPVTPVAGHYCARMSSWSATDGTADNMARAYDLGGQNVWVDGNKYWATGSWPGNDGEGILFQRSGCIEAFSTAITNNQMLNKARSSKSGYIGFYDLHVVGTLVFNNTSVETGWTAGIVKPVANYISEFADVNNKLNGTISETSTANPFPSTATNIQGAHYLTSNYPASPSISAPTGVTIATTADYADISWNPGTTGTTDNNGELGFRVERRIVGGSTWSVVAYRPMQTGYKPTSLMSLRAMTFNGSTTWTSAQLDLNPAAWRDYEKPATGTFEYRVVALGATEAQNAVSGVVAAVSTANDTKLTAYPNPTNDMLYLNSTADRIDIINLQGSIISSALHANQISLNAFANGLYIVKISSNGKVENLKIIKQ